jgi:DNA helicase-2/ATP-dependent DNA helicase PcrA
MNQPIYEIINESQRHDELKSSAGRLHLFAEMIDELRALSTSTQLDELYEMLINRTGYIRMLEEKASDENRARIENIMELKTNILLFMRENGGSLFDFLSETALYTDLDRNDNSADRVQMMTMHSAKGLEFNTVFIVGAEEGIFPGSRSIGDLEEIEEERRLCYVAMTRAMRKLYFTSARTRMLFGKTSSFQPSRFLKEIHSDNIEINKPRYKYYEFDSGYRDSSSEDFGFGSENYSSGSGHKGPVSSASSDSAPSSNSSASPVKQERRIPNTRIEPAQGQEQLPELRKGDSIEHKAFGRGVITDISKAGGDELLEIAFDDTGTKRMLLKFASRYIRKC